MIMNMSTHAEGNLDNENMGIIEMILNDNGIIIIIGFVLLFIAMFACIIAKKKKKMNMNAKSVSINIQLTPYQEQITATSPVSVEKSVFIYF